MEYFLKLFEKKEIDIFEEINFDIDDTNEILDKLNDIKKNFNFENYKMYDDFESSKISILKYRICQCLKRRRDMTLDIINYINEYKYGKQFIKKQKNNEKELQNRLQHLNQQKDYNNDSDNSDDCEKESVLRQVLVRY